MATPPIAPEACTLAVSSLAFLTGPGVFLPAAWMIHLQHGDLCVLGKEGALSMMITVWAANQSVSCSAVYV